ncbi:MAG: hypothetical protein RTU92_09060 [Candidatus Thorarchaeota archaeon]
MKKTQTILVILSLLGFISATTIIVFAESSKFIMMDQIILPGIPVEDSNFSNLTTIVEGIPGVVKPNWTSIQSDSIRYVPQFTQNTTQPSMLQIEELTTEFLRDEGLTGREFAGNISPKFLNVPHFLSNRMMVVGFDYHTSNSTEELIEMSVDIETMKVVQYGKYIITNSILSITSSDAEEIAIQFLEIHSYSIAAGSRLFQSRLTEGTALSSYQGTPVYEIVIRKPNGNVFPDRGVDGITIHVSRYGGEVVYFSCLTLTIPTISNTKLFSPWVAQREAEASVPIRGWNSTATFQSSYLRLVSCIDPEDSFALSWRYEYHTEIDSVDVYFEIGWNDAITGSYLFPGLYRDVSYPSSYIITPLILVLIATGVGTFVSMVYSYYFIRNRDI